MIRYIGVLLFFLILIPLILGQSLYELTKSKKKIFGIWIRGFVLELSLFELTYLIFSGLFSYNFRLHGIVYIGFILFIIVAMLIWSLYKIRKKEFIENIEKSKTDWKAFLFGSLLVLLLILVMGNMLLYEGASYFDGGTAESLNTILQSNTVGTVNPHTGMPYKEGQNAVKEPGILPFLAFLSWLLDVHPMVLLGKILPVLFIMLFYAFCFDIGKLFFKADVKKVNLFVLSILFLHVLGSQREWLPFYQLLNGTEIGERILSFLLLPMLVVEMMKPDEKAKWVHWGWLGAIVLAIVMMSNAGWFYAAVVLFLAIIVYVGRKQWEC